jgi:hypothetical protein
MSRHRRDHRRQEQFFAELLAFAHGVAAESARRRRHRRHRHGHPRLRRVLRGIGLIVLFTFVVIPGFLASLVFFGPFGMASLLAAPLLLLAAWGAILRWMFKQLPLPTRARPAATLPGAAVDLARLPEQTEAYIEAERGLLPWAAQSELEHITQRLGELAPQLRGLSTGTPLGGEVQRLLGEDLPKLVEGYRKLPGSLSQKPFYDGPSPEQKLVQGLSIIHGELGRMQERLARADLHALAEHQRYLELKYARKELD